MKDNKVVVLLLGILATFAIGVTLDLLQSVLLPLVVAVFLSYLFKPMMIALKRRRVPTVVSLLTVFVTIAAVLLGVSLVVYSSIDSFVQEAPKYQTRVNVLVSDVESSVESIATRLDLPVEELDWRQVFDVSSITGIIGTGLGTTVTFLGNVVLVMLYMFFILAATGQMSEKLRVGFTEDHFAKIADVIDRMDTQVRQYLLTKTLISLATGGFTALILWIFGVDFALFWGFLAFLLNFIPNVGSLLAAVFPVLLAFLQFDTIVQPIIILILLTSVQSTMGNIVEPKVMSFSLNLSPLVVLFALIFWGWLWGVVGMIIAVPMTSILKIVFENVDDLRPMARLLGTKTQQSTA